MGGVFNLPAYIDRTSLPYMLVLFCACDFWHTCLKWITWRQWKSQPFNCFCSLLVCFTTFTVTFHPWVHMCDTISCRELLLVHANFKKMYYNKLGYLKIRQMPWEFIIVSGHRIEEPLTGWSQIYQEALSDHYMASLNSLLV